jgi:sec-independent protein translocase protein TatA
MFGFHWAELLVVLIGAVIVFGPKRLPQLGGALGKGLRDFRHEVHEVKKEMGVSDIQETVRDVRDSVASLPQELEASTRPVETATAGAVGGQNLPT